MWRWMSAVALLSAALAGNVLAQQTSGDIEVSNPAGGRKTISPDWQKINAQPLGSRGNPIRADGPAGESSYMQRLRCANGGVSEIRRIGPAGTGPYTTPIDSYEIECDGDVFSMYLDRNHPGYVERRAPRRFTIRNP